MWSLKETVWKFVFLFLIWKLTRIIYWFYKLTFRKRLNLKKRFGEDSWALITGATDGIGKGFAQALAHEGFNIILVSRTLSKLKAVESELKAVNPSINTLIITHDFSQKFDLESYLSLYTPIVEGYDVSILVNNVGLGTDFELESMDSKLVYDTMNVNTIPQTILTKLFISKLNSRQKRSAIINLSSAMAIHPFPPFALYSSCKIYNDYFTRCLSNEYPHKIDCLSVRPFLVESNLTKLKAGKDRGMVITALECANGSLDSLGYENMTYGHWKHEIMGKLVELLPQWITNIIGKKRMEVKKKISLEDRNLKGETKKIN